MAVIKVGAATETELKEKKHRVEDALSATRAALEEGIVPGGGVAFLHAQQPVADMLDSLDGDERTGARIIHRALEEPIRQIARNAGADGSIVVDKVRTEGGNMGFNPSSRVPGPHRGRVPTRDGLALRAQNAASIAASS